MNQNKFSHYGIRFFLISMVIIIGPILLALPLFSQPLAAGHSKFLGNV